MRISIATAVACFIMTGLTAAQESRAAITYYDLNIPRQSLDGALKEFAQQTGLQVARFSDVVDGSVEVGPVRGNLSAAQALTSMLEAKGLTYRIVNATTLAIVQARGVAPSPVWPAVSGRGRSAAPYASSFGVDDDLSVWRRFRLAQAEQSSSARPGSGATPDGASSAERPVEEVIVTAQRREESLTRVPISISVLSGNALEAGTVTSVNDALRTVPGLAAYQTGQSGLAKFAMRGVTSNPSLFNGSSVVGYYFDEIPFAFGRYPVSPDVGAYDLERVEVLRGPQGTLYGANALNGVIRVVTKDANLAEFEFKGRTTFASTDHGSESYRADAAVSVPLVEDKLAVRAVVGYADYGGWIDRPFTASEDVNDAEQKSLRLKVNAAPTDKLSVELTSWFSRDDQGAPPVSNDDLTWIARFPEITRTDFDAYAITLEYDFPAFSLISATSDMKFRNFGQINSPPNTNDRLVTRLGSDLTSQEIRAVSTSEGPWRWSLGGIYRDARDIRRQRFDLLFPGEYHIHYESESFAVFGELTRSFADDRFAITGGVRYFEDESSNQEFSNFQPATQTPTSAADEFSATTPRVVFTFRPTDATSLYASYAQGFRSGFSLDGDVLRVVPTAQAVRPDRLHNYELGSKGSVLDGRVSYDLSLYYIDWKDTVQVLGILEGTPPNVRGVNMALNSEGATGPGVDFALSLKPTERFQLGATVSWNDLTFEDNVISNTLAGPVVVFAEGTRLPESPEMTAGGHVGYIFPINGRFAASVSGSVNYTSRMLTRLPNGTFVSGDNLLRARSSLGLESQSGWSAMLFVDNLTDEDGDIRVTGLPTGVAGDKLRPRTYGIQVDFEF